MGGRSRILIVEDERKTAETLQLYLERAGHLVKLCQDGRRGLDEALTGRYDLVVLDLMLPGTDGLEICRAIRQAELPTAILMLTARTLEEDRLRGLELGADDYVAKPFSPREVALRVKAILRRMPAGGRVLTHGPLALDRDAHELSVSGRAVPLTPVEFAILETLMSAPGRVFARTALVERARGIDSNALERTIDVHVMNLRRKIEPDRARPRFIVTVFGVGYKLAHALDPR